MIHIWTGDGVFTGESLTHHMEQMKISTVQEAQLIQESIEENISTIITLTVRHLLYQHQLDQGLMDPKLSDQQQEFLVDITFAAKESRRMIGWIEFGNIASDLMGVLAHLYACTVAGKIEKRMDPKVGPYPQKAYEDQLTYAYGNPAVKTVLAVANEGFSDEVVRRYKEFRYSHWALLATYLRTETLDIIYQQNRADCDSYRQSLRDVKAVASMLNENSEFTTFGLWFIASAHATYWHRCEDQGVSVLDVYSALTNIIDAWVKEGDSIRSEYA